MLLNCVETEEKNALMSNIVTAAVKHRNVCYLTSVSRLLTILQNVILNISK